MDMTPEQLDDKLLHALEMQELQSVTGMLYIRVHEGRSLRAMDRDGTSDPYCVTMVNGEKVRGSRRAAQVGALIAVLL
jgi:Ca2+-dependent lipid-binding protein